LNPWVMEPKKCVSNAEKLLSLEAMSLLSCNKVARDQATSSFVRQSRWLSTAAGVEGVARA
jgi:hypothetical protein